jgi:hypothetical protein
VSEAEPVQRERQIAGQIAATSPPFPFSGAFFGELINFRKQGTIRFYTETSGNSRTKSGEEPQELQIYIK